jgi:hypothetical protein
MLNRDASPERIAGNRKTTFTHPREGLDLGHCRAMHDNPTD